MKPLLKSALTALLLTCLAGCAGIEVQVSYPFPVLGGISVRGEGASAGAGARYREAGIASFYADKYQNRLTANGERFNQFAMTAAHKSLPFDSRVRVTNLDNGRSVVVRINDRGPFIQGRIIDLSRTAFGAIADHRTGIVDVVIEVLN